MALIKVTMGKLIEPITSINSELKYGPDDIRGMTITKQIIPTKANLHDTALDRFIIVGPSEFIYNPRTHGKKIGLGYNDTNSDFIISWNNTGFKVKKTAEYLVSPNYLYLYFNRSEWDREACFNSWGSSTEVFSWDAFCKMEIVLPPLDVQEKYASIYWGIKENLDALNRGIEQMQAACDSYMERLLKTVPKKAIGKFICEVDERNSDGKYREEDVRGLSTQKEFIATKANMNGVPLNNYKVVRPGYFAYVADTSRRGDKISLAYNESNDVYLVSSITTMFFVKSNELIPKYLLMFLKRPEFDRYARYNSWGSARETITWEDLGRLEIPLPSVEIQQDIVNIYDVMSERKLLRDRLIELQKKICPILIKGAVEEGGRA